MHQIVTTTFTPEEFNSFIENAFNRVVTSISAKSLNQSEIIDRQELIKRLCITEPTIIRWERKGKIPSLRIGGSVRYNWKAVLEALETKKKSGGLKK
jgi:predicted DNA-binding transcriptional regulator AlpA